MAISPKNKTKKHLPIQEENQSLLAEVPREAMKDLIVSLSKIAKRPKTQKDG